MGEFECYCAICGGPLKDVTQFIRDSTAGDRNNNHDPDFDNETTSLGQNSLADAVDDEFGYDPEVLSPEDVAWTATCHVLGWHDSRYVPFRATNPISI
jgi:hypothetical protein